MPIAMLPPAKPILFVEARFLWIFAIIFLVHWALKNFTARKVWLLVCSHAFYTCFFIGDPGEFFSAIFKGDWAKIHEGWWFPALLWGSTIMDYYVGLGIEAASTERKKRALVATSIAVNLGVLAFFKYYGFFEENVRALFAWMNLTPSWEPLRVFLPYGISFYTFQSLSYSIEVYRKKLPAERSFLNLATFVAFFPQVVAGPIVRAMTFLPQLRVERVWKSVDVRGCLVLFFMGFIKKACIGDTLAHVVDGYFVAPQAFGTFAAWMAILSYAGQIYCDFSGYSDMAIAISRLLGYELCLNFDFPYFSRNIAEFWRRWHMSLSSWLRDYLYISLGGNRGTKLFTYRNLFLTMLLGGLWHGASWVFVAWGALHGAALIVQREWQRVAAALPSLGRATRALGLPLTFLFVCLTWVPFRAAETFVDSQSGRPLRHVAEGFAEINDDDDLVHRTAELKRDPRTGNYYKPSLKGDVVSVRTGSFGTAATVLRSALFMPEPGAKRTLVNSGMLLVLGVLALVHWANYRRWLSTWWRRIPDWAFAAALGFAFALALFAKPTAFKPFIYFQF
jgi:alginate O-acetyltransferase complex protein AlgI